MLRVNHSKIMVKEKTNIKYMIKRTFFCILIFFLSSFNTKDGVFIDYCFPNEINKELSNYIIEQAKKDTTTNFFAMLNTVKDTIFLNIREFDDQSKSKLNDLINLSNRRINLGERKIPVLSKVDFLYSSILSKPNENGGIDNILFGGGGFYLHFYSNTDKKGIILRKGIAY